jgi:S-adenosylmethionine:diacylglycerol 3-amino-3-carboxypropyl transferase
MNRSRVSQQRADTVADGVRGAAASPAAATQAANPVRGEQRALPALANNVWERGRFDAGPGPQAVLFGRMYEDAAIEAGVFRAGGRVLCIASAGCTALRLCDDHDVVAIDINAAQLAYARSRFDGDRGQRGTAERVMGFGRSLAPLAGWWPHRLHAFLELTDPAEQTAYWNRHLNTGRFRVAFDTLLSLAALRAVYAAPFLDFLPHRLGPVLRGRMERCFAAHPNRDNRYARALLLGELGDAPASPSAHRIRLVHADAAAFLEQEPAGSFDGFSLSNILDGTTGAYGQRLFAAVRHAAAPGAMVVLRSFREGPPADPANHAAADRSMLWGMVSVRPAAGLHGFFQGHTTWI